jgi:hypothetical protein
MVERVKISCSNSEDRFMKILLLKSYDEGNTMRKIMGNKPQVSSANILE